MVDQHYPWNKKFKTKAELDAYFEGDRIVCLMCGKSYVMLGQHLKSAHNMDGDAYRARFGIPWRKGLLSETHRKHLGTVIEKTRAEGKLPRQPSADHISYIQERSKNRRKIMPVSHNALKEHGLKMHGRSEKWGKKDFEEFLKRLSDGRTITEVGRDKDMPCREVFDAYKAENSEFEKKFWKVWEKVPFHVQVRGQKTSRRFKAEVVRLKSMGFTWPEVAKVMGIKEGTARNTWFRLKRSGKLDEYLSRVKN